MAEDLNTKVLVTRVRVSNTDAQIDYNALANLPVSDKTLSEPNKFADAQVVGKKLEQKADTTYVDSKIENVKNDTTNINAAVKNVKDYVDESTSILKAKQENEGEILRVVKITNEDESESWETSWVSVSSALDATKEDEGKILTVAKTDGDDESESWVSAWKTPTEVLGVSKDHNGMILTVVDGEAVWQSPADAFNPSVDGGGGDDGGESGDNEQDKAGEVLINVNGVSKWESIDNAIASTATESGQFLSVDIITNEDNEVVKVAYWRTVIDADKVEF